MPTTFAPLTPAAPASAPRTGDDFATHYPESFFREHLLPRDTWSPFPPATDRAAWTALLDDEQNRARAAWLLAEAERLAPLPPPRHELGAILGYLRDDDRGAFDPLFYRPTRELAWLVLAECCEGRGRFVYAVADRLWAICETTSWSHPPTGMFQFSNSAPTSPLAPRDTPLTGVEDLPYPDLFACETAHAVMEACHLLAAPLDALHPAIRRRAAQACERLVLRPVLEREQLNWLDGRNNWTSWCSASALWAALYAWDDPVRLARLAHRLLAACDRLLANHGEDGGCDEGPAYWAMSAGCLYLFYDALRQRTSGAFDPFAHPKLRRMADYPPAMHLAGPWFANFADAGARPQLRRGLAAFVGRLAGNDELLNLARLAATGFRADGPLDPVFHPGGNCGSLQHALRDLVCLAGAPARPPRHALSRWLPDLQIAVLHEEERDARGFVLAAKGGHNDENHNHNDVGHVIALHDGEPLLCDLGPETYGRHTFTSRRYETGWTLRGSAHNAPLVNGREQLPGRERRAEQVRFTHAEAGGALSLGLASLYPPEAGLRALHRTARLRRGRDAGIEITDTFSWLDDSGGEVAWIFYTPRPPRADGAGLAWPGPRSVRLAASPGVVFAVSEVPLTDAWLRRHWGERVWRVEARARLAAPAGEITFRLSRVAPA